MRSRPISFSLYIGYLPYSVNGMWWSCLVIGYMSQQWARKRRPGWFKKVRHPPYMRFLSIWILKFVSFFCSTTTLVRDAHHFKRENREY